MPSGNLLKGNALLMPMFSDCSQGSCMLIVMIFMVETWKTCHTCSTLCFWKEIWSLPTGCLVQNLLRLFSIPIGWNLSLQSRIWSMTSYTCIVRSSRQKSKVQYLESWSQYPNMKPKITIANLVTSLGGLDLDDGTKTYDEIMQSNVYGSKVCQLAFWQH